MILSEIVMVCWKGIAVHHYKEKGYENPGYGNYFEIKVIDLPPGSGVKVSVSCDECGSARSVAYCRVSNLCQKCSSKKSIKIAIEKQYELMKDENFLQQMRDRMKHAASKIDKEKRSQRWKEMNEKRLNDPEYIKAFTKKAKEQINTPGYREKLIEGKRKFDSDPERRNKSKQKRKENRLKKFKKIIEEQGLDITPEEMEESRQNRRYAQDVKAWRYSIYKKFDFTCQLCLRTANKKNDISLNAHHIESWSENPHLRYEISNGICLCNKCHINFHSEYGKITNSQDFFEWISSSFFTNISTTDALYEFNKLCIAKMK